MLRHRKGKSEPASLVDGELKAILEKIEKATFSPHPEAIRCTSLYSETQLQKTSAEAIAESLQGFVDEDDAPLLKPVHYQSNIPITLGFFQVACGAGCCLLPFKKTPGAAILGLASLFFIGALISLFFEWFVCDGVVMTARDTRLAGTHEAPNGLTILCHFDKKKKTLRFAISPAINARAALNLASRKATKLLRTFHLFLYHIFWRVQTTGLAIAAQQKDECLPMTSVSPTPIQDDGDGGQWEWVDTPGSLPVDRQFGCFSDLVKFSEGGARKEDDQRSKQSTKGHSGLILERPITRYFDEKGTLLHEALEADLKSLLSKYYMLRFD